MSVLGRQTDQEGVLHEVDPFGAAELAAFRGGVLVADGDVELAAEEARFKRARRELAEPDPEVVMGEPQPCDRRWHEARKGSRERTDPDRFAPPGGEGRELRVGELEAPRDV